MAHGISWCATDALTGVSDGSTILQIITPSQRAYDTPQGLKPRTMFPALDQNWTRDIDGVEPPAR